jgi:peroxiredoxin Q/BCP
MAGRVTFVIDRTGIVRMVFNSQVGFMKHVTKALDLVRSLEKAAPAPAAPPAAAPPPRA